MGTQVRDPPASLDRLVSGGLLSTTHGYVPQRCSVNVARLVVFCYTIGDIAIGILERVVRASGSLIRFRRQKLHYLYQNRRLQLTATTAVKQGVGYQRVRALLVK